MVTATVEGTGLVLSGSLDGSTLTVRRDGDGLIEVLDAGGGFWVLNTPRALIDPGDFVFA